MRSRAIIPMWCGTSYPHINYLKRQPAHINYQLFNALVRLLWISAFRTRSDIDFKNMIWTQMHSKRDQNMIWIGNPLGLSFTAWPEFELQNVIIVWASKHDPNLSFKTWPYFELQNMIWILSFKMWSNFELQQIWASKRDHIVSFKTWSFINEYWNVFCSWIAILPPRKCM